MKSLIFILVFCFFIFLGYLDHSKYGIAHNPFDHPSLKLEKTKMGKSKFLVHPVQILAKNKLRIEMIKQLASKEIKEYLKTKSDCVLLDIRTQKEWDRIGKPDGETIGLKTYLLPFQFGERRIF